MSKSERRRRILVDREVQGALVSRLAMHWIVAFSVSIFYLLILQMFSSGLQRPVWDQLGDLWTKYSPLTLVALTLFPVFIYDTLRLSHRFAGPMVSFRRQLKHLADGKTISPSSCRDGDFWTDVSDHLNRISQMLGQSDADSKRAGH